MPFFPYGTAETAHLTKQDPALGRAIARIGHIERELRPDLFTALLHSIAGQQISGKAQASVWARVCECFGDPVAPAALLQPDAAALLRGCGLSGRKVGYMQEAARAVVSGALAIDALHCLDDEAFCRTLARLPGVGRWTAEMLLIFSLARPDVLSYGDLGIRRGLMRLHQLEAEPTLAEFTVYRERYAPYGTVASLYLWAIAGGA